jgi:gliding motility-associated-like protein
MNKLKAHKVIVLLILGLVLNTSGNLLLAQTKKSSCANSDFASGDFTNWVGYTSVYPYSTPGTNIGTPQAPYPSPAYYYKQGIVNGRHTIITTSTPDPFTCGNVLTLPPNEKTCVRLGNGGIGPWGNGVVWQRDYLNYTFNITLSNALLIYKYAVVLQDPGPNHHEKALRPRFIVSIRDGAGNLIDPVCGVKEDFADSTVSGYRNCSEADAAKLGGKAESEGDIVYRAWTTVGVDLRGFIGQNVTIGFETWDCGLGGHFGYAYLMARCDSLGIIAAACSSNGAVRLTAPDGFAYKWSPGGQTTKTIDIVGAKPGDVATVELTTVSGCKTSISTKIYPMFTKANYTESADSVCINTPINFVDSSYSIYTNDNSKVPIVDWHWNFGDGSSATTPNATHAYKKEGTYKVVLRVINKNGCLDSLVKLIKVFPAPIANFYFDDICMNGTAVFQDASVQIGGGPVTKGWTWTFGDDNSTSTLQNPTHVFKTPGTYQIKLTVSDLGCADDTTQTIKIFPLPVADYTISEVCVGAPTTFTDKSVNGDATDVISKWIWDFGDHSALSSSKNPVHTYAKEGTYITSLIVTTKLGCIGTVSKTVIVRPIPKALFSATPLCLSEPVVFTDNSLPTGDIVEWYWSFDNRQNNHSTEQNPKWQYDTSSVYTPKLVIKSKYGCVDSTTISLNIPPLPYVNFDADLYESCVPLKVKFLDFSFSSSDKIKTWSWDFGDGSPADTSRNPPHEYTVPGTYDVTLSVSTANSCKATYTWVKMMNVYPMPVAAFIFSPEEPTESDNTVVFYDRAIDAVFWSWDFGDTGLSAISTSTDQNPTHTFPTSGTYTIWQFVTSPHGCRDSIPAEITIKPDWTFYVPNVFTPNGDGKNDGFIPKGHNITQFQMWIFDRWGNMIYDTKQTISPETAIPWNGHANNGTKTAQEDVYVWLVELKDINNMPHKYIGHVSIVR